MVPWFDIMILHFAYYGNSVLRKKALPIEAITDDIRKLAADMIETIKSDSHAIGLAAPQVHRSIALFIVQFPDPNFSDEWVPGPFEVHINPKILEVSDTSEIRSEGCLSIPKVYADVERPLKIKFQSMDLDGNVSIKDYEGFPARMLLHENDHLNGVLFIDRISSQEKKRISSKLKDIKKKYNK